MTPVTVITPTWQRHDFLLDRCIPSVSAQHLAAHLPVAHIVVSDGPDAALRYTMRDYGLVNYLELPEHREERHWGNPARLFALEHVKTDYIAYCDDDDALRPEHCFALSQSLDANPDCGFVVSQMLSHSPGGNYVIGEGPPVSGNVGTPMIMHRRELLDIASWGYDSATEDWELVLAWVNAGVKYSRVNRPTVDVWPSAFR